jgi:tol-pal system protein YbgF
MARQRSLNEPATPGRLAIRTCATCVIAVMAAMLALPAGAQDNRDVRALTQKIERLQGELNDLQRRVYGGDIPESPGGDGGPTDPETSAGAGATDPMTQAAGRRLRERMSALENDLRRLTGQVQETQHRLREATKRVDKLVKDVDYRLRALEDFQKQAAAKLKSLTANGEGNGHASADSGRQDEEAQTARADGDEGRVTASAATSRDDITPNRNRTPPADDDAGNGRRTDGGSGTIGTVSKDAVDQLRREAEESAKQTGGNDKAQADSTQAASNTQTASKPSGSDVLPDAQPQAQYDHAFKLLSDRDYAKAEKALQAFVETHPKHKLAGNAKYWLGETYYVRGNYNQAAVVFAEGFRTYPDSRKAPDNLLKLGITLAKIDKVDKACRLFSELQKRFPDAAQNIRHRAQREEKRLGCTSGS